MEAVADKGLAKSIGVSNYSIGQMRKTLANAKIPPAVNQVLPKPILVSNTTFSLFSRTSDNVWYFFSD